MEQLHLVFHSLPPEQLHRVVNRVCPLGDRYAAVPECFHAGFDLRRECVIDVPAVTVDTAEETVSQRKLDLDMDF